MSGIPVESQESVGLSEEWNSDDDEDVEDYSNYYGDEDPDAGFMAAEGDGEHDASFQSDPEHYHFSCLSSEETWNYLDSQARETSRDIKLDVPASRILLQHLHWDSKKLVQSFSVQREELLESAHLVPGKDVPAVTLLGECPVCLSPLSGSCRLRKLPCGHVFCLQCCVDHILARLAVRVSTAMECLQCDRLLDLETVQSLLSERAEDMSRYLRYALSDYVVSHPFLRWCPGPNCTVVFKVKEPQAKKVTCSNCNTSCCFFCGESYHCPTDCESIREWLIKCHDDSETANYIMANTKECPKCHASIEKNGGCNHMCCSQCHYDFCWMCLEAWKDHTGYYNCSKYQEDTLQVNEARQALEKYLFYYHRWANHELSLSLEEVTKKKIVDRIEEKVGDGDGTWIDWQYLLDAVALLRKCRYTLQYTYPYAYFMSSARKPLFEYQQAQLEVEIENLSWKVERAETTDVAELRQQMNAAEVKRLTLLRDFVSA